MDEPAEAIGVWETVRAEDDDDEDEDEGDEEEEEEEEEEVDEAATLPAALLLLLFLLPLEKKPPFMPPNIPAAFSFRVTATFTSGALVSCSLLSCLCCCVGWLITSEERAGVVG